MKSHNYSHCIALRTLAQKHIGRMAGAAAATLVLTLMGCSSAPQTEHWTLFNNAPTAAPVGKNAKIVVYRKSIERDPSTTDHSPANIYVDGNYIASLLPMASTEVLVCPGQHRLSARANLSAGVLGDKTVDSMGQELASGSIKYFMVQYGEDATPRLFPVMPEQAVKDLSGMRRQVHTLPRVKTPAC